jgi:hypothetical protein
MISIAIKCTYSSTEQNNKMTKNGSEKENTMSLDSLEVGTMSSNVVKHALGTEIGSEMAAKA